VSHAVLLHKLTVMKGISPHLNYVDSLGASASLLCAIHCVLTPFVTSILPLLGVAVLANERIEHVVLLISLTLATTSVCWGIRVHNQRRILVLFGAALSLVLFGRLLMQGSLEVIFVVSGALLLVCAHLLNHHLCRTCSVCESRNPSAVQTLGGGISNASCSGDG
jgi:MerC mercury resistance protein